MLLFCKFMRFHQRIVLNLRLIRSNDRFFFLVFSLTCWFQTPGVLTKQDCIPIVHNTCATITTATIKDGKISNSISKACSNDLLGCNSLCKETIKQIQRLDPSTNVTSCNVRTINIYCT